MSNEALRPTAHNVSTLYGQNHEPLVPKFFFANIAASQTASSLVAAVTGKRIRVLLFRIMAGATATDVTFNTNTAACSEKFACGINGGISAPYSPVGHFQTVAGEPLTLTTGAGSTVGVGGTYVEV